MGQLPCAASVLTPSAVSREAIWGNYVGELAGGRMEGEEQREGNRLRLASCL